MTGRKKKNLKKKFGEDATGVCLPQLPNANGPAAVEAVPGPVPTAQWIRYLGTYLDTRLSAEPRLCDGQSDPLNHGPQRDFCSKPPELLCSSTRKGPCLKRAATPGRRTALQLQPFGRIVHAEPEAAYLCLSLVQLLDFHHGRARRSSPVGLGVPSWGYPEAVHRRGKAARAGTQNDGECLQIFCIVSLSYQLYVPRFLI